MLSRPLGSGSSSAYPDASGSNRSKGVQQVNDLLYELYKPEGTPTVQVLFFHGLWPGDLSNAHLSTWRSEDDSCVWPQEWLPDTFPRAHTFTVSYSACAKIFDMYLLGENLVSDLLQAGIGQITSCPVILVGHCVGGLVIKQICCQAHDKLHSNKAPFKKKLRSFLGNIGGMFYYSTPHHGSSIIAKATEGPLFQFFKTLNENAERLNSKFEDVQSKYKWLIFGLGECLPTTSILPNYSNVVVVPEASSRQGDHFLIVVADHNSICQPSGRMDRRFYHLKDLIENILTELEEDTVAHQESNVEGVEHQNSQLESLISFATPTTIPENWYLGITSATDHQNSQPESLIGFTTPTTIPENWYYGITSAIDHQNSQPESLVSFATPTTIPENMVTFASIPIDTPDFYDNVPDLRWQAMESIIWLLDKPVEDGKWTLWDVECVRKVHRTYICNHELDSESISHLLKLDACPAAQLATLKVISEICTTDQKPLFRRNNLNFLPAIVDLLHLKEGLPTQVQLEASRALWGICWKATQDQSTLLIVDTPGVLDILLSLLAPYDLFVTPGVLDIVLSLMAPDDLFVTLRHNATAALANLLNGPNSDLVGWRIASREGALVSLVKLLSAHSNPIIQEHSALALQNLAMGKDIYLKLRIATEEGAIDGLVECLFVQACPVLLKNVAHALGNVFGSSQKTAERGFCFPRGLSTSDFTISDIRISIC